MAGKTFWVPPLVRGGCSGALRWTLRRVFRYRYEICHRCGLPVAWFTPSWWHADDALWIEVEGGEAGIRCAPCFTRDCRALGIGVSWRPVVESRSL